MMQQPSWLKNSTDSYNTTSLNMRGSKEINILDRVDWNEALSVSGKPTSPGGENILLQLL